MTLGIEASLMSNMNPNSQEPMSFAPVLVMRPIDVPPPKFHKTVSERIQRYLRADVLPNLVYSISEARSVRSARCPPGFHVAQLATRRRRERLRLCRISLRR
jgi:hypothetical protein